MALFFCCPMLNKGSLAPLRLPEAAVTLLTLSPCTLTQRIRVLLIIFFCNYFLSHCFFLCFQHLRSSSLFSRVLRDSMTRYVGRLVCRLVGWSISISFFWHLWAVFALLLLPNHLNNLFYNCPCPPAHDFGSSVYGLVLVACYTALHPAMSVSPLVGWSVGWLVSRLVGRSVC